MGKAAPTVYEIMHGDRKVAQIDQYGHSKIYFESFMPYNLYQIGRASCRERV